MEIEKLPYAKWLEGGLRKIVESGSESIAILTIQKDGEILTGYWQCSTFDKELMAAAIRHDAMMEVIRANKNEIREILEEGEE